MKKPVLVIMAAGMGSRYGGLKQMDPVGPSGEVILDYSIFDARRAEIDGDGVKRGLRAAQHHRRRAPDGAVWAIGGNELAADGEAAAAAEGAQQHQCRRFTGDAYCL